LAFGLPIPSPAFQAKPPQVTLASCAHLCLRRPGNSSSLSVTRLLLLLVIIFRMLMVLCAHVCRVSSFSCLVVPSALLLCFCASKHSDHAFAVTICFSLYGVHVIAFLLDMESYMTTLQQELYECIQEQTL